MKNCFSMIHRDNKYQRNASMNGTRKNWKNKQRSMTPWNMDVYMIDCSINLATKEKKKKTFEQMWEAKSISFPLFVIRWLPLYPIRESWGEKRNRRTHKKKKKEEARGSRGSSWTPAEIRMKREQQVGGQPRFHTAAVIRDFTAAAPARKRDIEGSRAPDQLSA